MNAITNEVEIKYRELFSRWTNRRIIGEIVNMERLLQSDEMNECVLLDEAMDVLTLLRDECVNRVYALAGYETEENNADEKQA